MKEKLLRYLVTGAFVLVGVAILDSCVAKDDSDPVKGRSGFTIYTDYKTGCQYLSTLVTMTPRMDNNGKQVCQ